jgi:high-affinity nickel-transport protein
LALNGLAWAWAVAAFHSYPLLLGIALLAYSLGLRHGVDADHIAAIDNVTRKLMHAGQRPVSVGLYFSLGHCTVVLMASIILAATASAMNGRLQQLRDIGSVVGTLVSALFLFAIALMNVLVLVSLCRVLLRVRDGGAYPDEQLDPLPRGCGLLTRMFRPLFRLITRSWHMYPLGLLFGLGFDTATEIAVLGISATQAAKGLPLWSILVFPVLFTAGMSLIDTVDGTLMLGAYGWAFIQPIRKLYYNLTITFISVAIAIWIGSVEVLGLWAGNMSHGRPSWDVVSALNGNLGTLGFIIIGVFMLCWLISITVYRMKRYDHLEGGG